MPCIDWGSKIAATSTDASERPTYAGSGYDGNTGSAWWTSSYSGLSGEWWELYTSTAKQVERVRIYNGSTNRMPTDFTIEASTTGAFAGEEVTLLSVSSYSWSADWNEWEFTNANSYNYFRMVCGSDPSGGVGWYVYEIEFYICVEEGIEGDGTDEIGFADSDTTEIKDLSANKSEGIGFDDSVIASSFSETVEETTGFDDSVDAFNLTERITEGIGFADSGTGGLEYVADETDSAGFSDGVVAQDFVGRVADGIGLDDSETNFAERPVSVSNENGFSDSAEVVNFSEWQRENAARATLVYYCTLTGAADGKSDLTLPIKSFQARRRTGQPTYLSVTIPGVEYAGDIADRPNGEIVIEQAYKVNGEVSLREEIVRVDFDNANDSRGPRNRSIVLTGYKTQTIAGQAITLSDPVYRNYSDNLLRYRFAAPDPYVRPGDTVTVGDDTFTAGLVTYSISVNQQTMEVAQAA